MSVVSREGLSQTGSTAFVPTASIVIPTLNSGRFLRECLASIRMQDYPADRLEVIIVDAGSSDDTLAIVAEYGVQTVLANPLHTGEAGKAIGVRHACHELVVLIDSDNILPSPDWLRRMVAPFADGSIFGSEPIEYTYRRSDALITRYCALIGMNDPLCLFLGNYDRMSLVTGRWTECKLEARDQGDYLKLALEENNLPTIGANGAIFRRSVLESLPIGDYFFDIDVTHEAVRHGWSAFAKVRIGIVHVYCTTTKALVRKQYRRARDYFYFQSAGTRSYPWNAQRRDGVTRFIVSTVLLWPLLRQSWVGYRRRADIAWLFHPVACWITLAVYGYATLRSQLNNSQLSRHAWSQ